MRAQVWAVRGESAWKPDRATARVQGLQDPESPASTCRGASTPPASWTCLKEHSRPPASSQCGQFPTCSATRSMFLLSAEVVPPRGSCVNPVYCPHSQDALTCGLFNEFLI